MGVAVFTAEAEDFAAAADSTEDLAGAVDSAAVSMHWAAGGDLAREPIAEADLDREDLAAGLLAGPDLGRKDLAKPIADLGVGAQEWDGTSEAWAAVLDAENGLRIFREQLRMGGGTDSETAGAW